MAGLLIAATLALFFVWTYPANQATGNWTSAPENWEQLRTQWEYSHAANAALTFVALLCAVGAALSTGSRQEIDGRDTADENTTTQNQNRQRVEPVASKPIAADTIAHTASSPQAQQRRVS